MEDPIADALWPKIPEHLRKKEVRLPAEFRAILANREYENEEIGRIVRCLLLNTDMFNNSKVGGVIHYFRQLEEKKSYIREAVKRHRAKKKGQLPVEGQASQDGFTVKQEEFTVKQVDITEKRVELVAEPLVPIKKTPTTSKEKTPPIVPLKKKAPSFLEKAKLEVQGDLFASVGETERQESATGGPLGLPDVSDVKTGVQDIESDSRPVEDASEAIRTRPTATDSRSDAAWIPQKFNMFWSRYPRKVAKKDAMKAFTKVIKAQPDVERFMNMLLASIEWWKAQDGWKKDDGKFIPYPATWLNRGSWEDSIENGSSTGTAEFLSRSEESDDDLIRRMTGG